MRIVEHKKNESPRCSDFSSWTKNRCIESKNLCSQDHQQAPPYLYRHSICILQAIESVHHSNHVHRQLGSNDLREVSNRDSPNELNLLFAWKWYDIKYKAKWWTNNNISINFKPSCGE
jgi:hypothetical protein